MPCAGAVDLSINFKGKAVVVDALVSRGMTKELILSWYDLVRLNVLPCAFPNAMVVATTTTPQQSSSPRPSYAATASKNC